MSKKNGVECAVVSCILQYYTVKTRCITGPISLKFLFTFRWCVLQVRESLVFLFYSTCSRLFLNLKEMRMMFFSVIFLHADLRTRDMLFLRSMGGMFALTGAYLVMAVVGPRVMANRKAFDLRWPMFLYNVVISAFSLWMCLEVRRLGLKRLQIHDRWQNYGHLR